MGFTLGFVGFWSSIWIGLRAHGLEFRAYGFGGLNFIGVSESCCTSARKAANTFPEHIKFPCQESIIDNGADSQERGLEIQD